MSRPPAFVFHPQNRDFALGLKPQPAYRGTFTLFGLLFLVPFILAGLFLLAATAREWSIWRQLTAGGATAQGVVLGKRIVADSEGDGHFVRYGFAALRDGRRQEFSAEQRVRPERYAQLRQAAPVAVRYFAGNPALSRLEGEFGRGLTIFLSCFTVFWNLCIGAMTYAALRERRVYRLLRRHGVVIDGTITSAGGEKDSDGDYMITVCYQFQAPDAALLAGKESRLRNDLKDGLTAPPGTPVRIWYAAPALFRLI